MFIPRLINGRMKCVEAEPVVWNGGYGYDSRGSLCIYLGTPPDGGIAGGGPLRTHSGRVCVSYGGIVDGVGGIALDSAGRMVISDGGAVVEGGNSGLPQTASGAVAVDSSAFSLEFADLGAGVVSLATTQGEAAATFTRATAASTVLSNGLIGTVASGSPRSYYDPTTLTYLGYLAEGARTNLLLRSQEFDDAAWTKTDTTVTADNTASPDGTVNADLITDGSAGTASLVQSVTATADVTYSAARWFKRGNTDFVYFDLFNGANRAGAWFNLATGVVGSVTNVGTATGATGRIKAYPNGWYRCEIVGAVGSGATAIGSRSFSVAGDGVTTRVNNATRFEWGAQFENNVSLASSYIATAGATVTRNADVLTYPTTGWFSQVQGSFFAQFGPIFGNDVGFSRVIGGDAASQTPIAANSTTSTTIFDGATAANSSPSTSLLTTQAKSASAYGTSFIGISLNGTAVGSSASYSGTILGGTLLQISGNAVNTRLYGPVARIAYFPTRLPNAQLQAMTQ